MRSRSVNSNKITTINKNNRRQSSYLSPIEREVVMELENLNQRSRSESQNGRLRFVSSENNQSVPQKGNLDELTIPTGKSLQQNKEKKEYREVPIENILTGCNRYGTPDSRIVIPEANDPDLVKEYTKLRSTSFYCVACNTKRKHVVGKMFENFFYAPILHLTSCEPITKQEAQQNLQKNSAKVPKERRRSRSSPAVVNNDENELNFEIPPQQLQLQKRTNDTNSRTRTHSAQDQKLTNNVGNETHPQLLEQEVLTENHDIVDGPLLTMQNNGIIPTKSSDNTKKLKTVSFGPSEIRQIPPIIMHIPNENTVFTPVTKSPTECFSVEFNHPSARWLKNACNKFQLCYDHDAYCIWGNIKISNIKETSKAQDVQKITEGKASSFCALSYLISGKENNNVESTIRNHFYDNFKTLGKFGEIDFSLLTHESKIIKNTIFAEFLTPELWHMISKLLECRVGIFSEDELKKYGNWNDQNFSDSKNDEIVTLLFQTVGNDYYIVKSII